MAETDVEAMPEHERVARFEVGFDVSLVAGGLFGVRNQHHDNVGFGAGGGGGLDGQTGGGGRRPGRAAVIQSHTYISAAVAQIEGVGVPLATVAEDGDFLPSSRSRFASLS